MHLVIGAGEFVGRHVSRALATEVPVIELSADADDETLADAIAGVEVVVSCAQTVSPAHRLRYRKGPAPLLARLLEAAGRARVTRLVHVSTADVFGSDQATRVTEKSKVKPAQVYERLKLAEEDWLLENAGDVEVVILRPARVFGEGEDWILPRLMASMVRGRVWLPGGGRARQTFIAADDLGRACLAASDRGRPGHRYLVGGFDSTWQDFLISAARAVGFSAEVGSVPYDLAYLRALAVETTTPEGAAVWPGVFAVDAIGKPHIYDDSYSRRELTWSPSVGSLEQEIPAMTPWLSSLPEVAAAIAEAQSAPRAVEVGATTSPPGT
ncbi:MAG TPA: NAD-dependent epimerase/dehydratase family protein [Candidatus Dormibacteraeota bacterium]|nr:NAD-dependent epimerase/dehydratase family protein [Candidatus Dormibacteraeota bacterium]